MNLAPGSCQRQEAHRRVPALQPARFPFEQLNGALIGGNAAGTVVATATVDAAAAVAGVAAGTV